MSDHQNTPFPDNRENAQPPRDQLIESIYRIALEPMAYDSFMGHWDDYISGRLDELNQLKAADRSANSPEIETHFQIAAQLLDQIGRPMPDAKEKAGVRNPQMLVDTGGRIVWSSSAASQLFALGPIASLEDLPLDAAQTEALGAMRSALDAQEMDAGDQAPPPSPVLLNLTPPTQPGSVQYMVARVLAEQQSGDLILITTIAPQWPAEMERLLRTGFALSVSEIEICELIADGLNPAAIAEARRSALATVRTQIKKVMAKTHCGSQAELVRLLHSVMRVADQEAENAKQRPIAPERETHFTLADRTMPVREFGDPSGYPVVYFHGMLDGIPIRKSFEAELTRHKLRLICPIRPYFGFAAGAKGAPRSAPERFGHDVAKMITEMGLKKPILLGYMGGAIYAHGVAAALPEDALRGMLHISGAVPILSTKQFSNMSRRQRLVAYTARFTPSILPFVIRAGISQMDRGGATVFMQSLYENRPFDMAIASEPNVRDTILEGFRFTVQQGHRAFEIDSHVIVNDWSALVEASTVRLRILHGAHDPACDVEAVRDFAQRYRHRASIEVLAETGQLILYKYPEKVIAELCAIRDHGVVLN